MLYEKQKKMDMKTQLSLYNESALFTRPKTSEMYENEFHHLIDESPRTNRSIYDRLSIIIHTIHLPRRKLIAKSFFQSHQFQTNCLRQTIAKRLIVCFNRVALATPFGFVDEKQFLERFGTKAQTT